MDLSQKRMYLVVKNFVGTYLTRSGTAEGMFAVAHNSSQAVNSGKGTEQIFKY